jgi:hypothetical protein
MGLLGKSIITNGSRLAHRSSLGRQLTETFALILLEDAMRRYGEINWSRIFRTILLTCYLGCYLRWRCFVSLRCNAFRKLMWCTCLWRHDAHALVVGAYDAC